ncbi:MAG: DUF4286 family protein [Bacteroidetes bacterium]|nr:DUF4286 family protein [Bacteroidota bacterium]
MILYNVTVNIAPEVHMEWLEWMKHKHIPDVLSTGLFIENRIFRVLTTEEDEGFTYSVQYFLDSMEKYETYREVFAPALQAEHTEKYRDQFVAFRTLLETA